MQKLISVFLLFFSLSALGQDTYVCSSRNGQLSVVDFPSGEIVLDASNHRLIWLKNAYSVFAAMVEPQDMTHEFVMALAPMSYSQSEGMKFENSLERTFVRSVVPFGHETCAFYLNLNKEELEAKISYSCRVLFKKTTKLDETLRCEMK